MCIQVVYSVYFMNCVHDIWIHRILYYTVKRYSQDHRFDWQSMVCSVVFCRSLNVYVKIFSLTGGVTC